MIGHKVVKVVCTSDRAEEEQVRDPHLAEAIYSGLHLHEESKKAGRNKRSISGIDEHAGNGLRLGKRYVFSLK